MSARRHVSIEAMPVTVAPEHQPLSFGRLATPDRNHTCPACSGSGRMLLDRFGAVACPRCAGVGERKANREPADHAFPDLSDRAVRARLSADRSAGKLGAR